MKILITGIAGFIGYHLAHRLLKEGYTIIGIDNLNSYYDPSLKLARLRELGISNSDEVSSSKYPLLEFHKYDLSSNEDCRKIEELEDVEFICHLAAQAGVRSSILHPELYIQNNLVGFANILDLARKWQVKHLVYASSSSIYGMNTLVPFSVKDRTDYPVSLYAATKKSNEIMAYSYSHLYQIPTTGLRFFTVYGPWGRPDMAYFLFTKAILEGKPIKIFNRGEMERDFTYIDDIINGIQLVIPSPPQNQVLPYSKSKAPYTIYNIGNNAPVNLLEFIKIIEKELGMEAKKEWLPMQDGDVPITYADSSGLFNDFGYQTKTSLEEGIKNFVEWYKDFYNIGKDN